MAEPFIGEIRLFGFNFAPRGWAMCNGQLLAISQNTALFSLLGTNYGGDGVRTFALPDLRSRVAIHEGQGSGLSPYTIGEAGGAETVTLTVGQMPSHAHYLKVSGAAATSTTPSGNVLARATANVYGANSDGSKMHAGTIPVTGGSQPHTNVQPFLAVNFCIALQGIFPSRN